jgi:hypothetical protein
LPEQYDDHICSDDNCVDARYNYDGTGGDDDERADARDARADARPARPAHAARPAYALHEHHRLWSVQQPLDHSERIVRNAILERVCACV